jgi:EamA domain-containing membrane protein RarD
MLNKNFQCKKANLRKEKMNTKTEGTLAIIAALIVLLSALWDPQVSAAVSIVALLGFGIYKFTHNK